MILSFKLDLCDGFDVQAGIAILIEKGWLIPDSEGKSTRSEYLPFSKSTVRCYRIDGNKFSSKKIDNFVDQIFNYLTHAEG